jgi:hypothetical protein
MKIVFASKTFMYGPRRVDAGTHWPADDPAVRDFPGHFTESPAPGLQVSQPLTDEQQQEVGTGANVRVYEAATREPGEKRNTPPRVEQRG